MIAARTLRPVLRIRPTSLACGVIAAASMVAAPLHALGQTDTQKANNTVSLLTGSSWVSNSVPTTTNVLVWSNTVTGANTVALGGSGTFAGIRIANPGGAVVITNAAGNVLGIGASGIDMSAATQNLSIFTSVAAADIRVTANQDWNIASGRSLTLFNAANGTNIRLLGSSNIAVKGGGTVNMNVGVGDAAGTGTNTANGNGSYTGNWTISGGSKVISLRNGYNAWGQGSITLDNGTMSQTGGNWTFWNNIAVNAGGGTIFSDSSSTNRFNILGGVISGTGALTFNAIAAMTGQEGFILTGANTFTGPLTIGTNGTVRIGGANTLQIAAGDQSPGNFGSIPSSVVITNNGRFGFGWNDVRTFANNIGGTGSVRNGTGVATPAGYVTLSGTNTYSGGTQVNSGGLIFSSTAAKPGTGTVTVAAAGAIGLGVGASPTYYTATDIDNLFNGSPTGYSITAGAGIGLDTSAGDFTYSSNVGGVSRALFKSGSNTLTLSGNNAYTGATTVVAGTLSVSADSNLGAVPGAATAGNVRIRENATLLATTGFTLSTNRGVALGPTTGSGTGTIAVDASQTLTFGGTMANNGGTGALGKAGAGTLTLTSTGNSYTGDTVISNGTLKISGGKLYNAGFNNTAVITINSGGTLELDSFGYDALGSTGQLADYGQRRLLNGGSINVVGNTQATGNDFYVANASSGTFTMATAGETLTLSGNANTNIAIGGPLTFGGAGNIVVNEVIENNVGTGSIVKAGAGTLTLAAVNTYTGATTINAGTVSVAADTGLGAAPGAFTAGSLVVNGGVLAVTTGFTLSANRGVAVGPGSGSGSGTFDVASGQTLTYGGTIANNGGGTGGLTKIGSGTLALSGASTYTGATAIDAGVLQIGAGSTTGAISSSSAVSVGASGTLAFNRTADLTFANVMSGAGTIQKLTANTVNFTGSNSFSGLIDIQAGKVAFQAVNSVAGAPSVNVAAGAILSIGDPYVGGTATIGGLTGSGTVDPMFGSTLGTRTLGVNQAGSGTFSGIIRDAISGAVRTLALTKSGAGTLTLAGTATYTGPTAINGGTLRIEGSGVMSGSSAVAVADVAGATFDLNGTSQTVAGLSGGGATGGAVELGAGTLTVSKASGSDTFGGVVNGSGGLVKTGSGALVLNGVNGYSGPTTISGGTLQIGGAGQLNAGTYAAAIANAGAFVYSSSANQTLSGVVSGIGSLTHSGAGAVTLTGSNTYTGNTTIGSGTLEVGGDGRLGGGAYAGAIANDGSLRFTTSADQALSGGITGNGSLLKSGGGRLTLTGANNYSGATTVDAGRLVVNGQVSTSAITVNAGAFLGGSGTVADVTLAGGGVVSPGNSPGLLTVANMAWSGTSAYDWELYNYQSTEGVGWDSIAGSGSLTVNATSASPFTFNLLSLSGTSTLGPAFNWSQTTSGSFRVASFTGGITLAEPSGTWWSMNTAGFTPFDPATGAFSLSTTSNDIYLVYTYTPPPSFVWTVGSGSWSTAGNWDTNTAPSGTPELFFSGAGGTATNDITTGTGAGEIATVKGITFTGSASGGYTLDGNAFNLGTLGVTNNSTFQQSVQNGMTLSVDSTLNAASAGLVVSGTIDTNGDILTVTGSNTTTLASVVTGSGSLVKLGSGTAILQGPNDYTGGTTINAGTVVVGDGATAGVLPGSVTNNATLVFDRTDDVTYAGVISGTGGVTKVNAATLTLTANSTSTGLLTITGGTVQVGDGGTSGSLAGNVTNNAALVFNRSDASTYAGGIGGTGAVTKTGAGALALTGSSSYSGGTTLSAGSLQIGSDSALGTGTATLNGGAVSSDGGTSRSLANSLVFGGDMTLGDATNNGALTFTGPAALGGTTRTLTAASNATLAGIVSDGGLTKAGSATLTLTGVNTYAGDTTISSGTLALGGAGQLGGGSYAGAISNSGVFSVATSANQTLSGSVGGTGSLVKSGGGTLTLSNSANGYTGGSTISGGTVSFVTGGLGPSGAVTVNGGALRWATGNTEDVSGRLTLVNSTTATLDTNGNDVTLATGFGGATSGAVTKVGAGTLTYTGNNTYTGVTTVSTGTLQLGAGGSSGAVAGNIANEAALVFNRSDSATYAGIISGAGSLTQAGSGTTVLSAASTYTGPTTINAGVLQIGAGSTTGAISSSSVVTIASGGTLAFNRSNSINFANSVSGAGTMLKLGANDHELSGSNSFTGLIDIQAGKIALNSLNAAAGSPRVNIASGATLSLGSALSGGTATISGLSGAGTVDTAFAGTTDTRTLNIAQATSGTFTGRLIDANSSRLLAIVKSGPGTLTLTSSNNYTGGTTLVSGTLVAANGFATGTAGTVTINTAATGSSDTSLMIDASAANVTVPRAITVANQGSGVTTLGSSLVATGGQAIFSGAITLAKDVTLYGADNGAAGRTQFSGGIGGTGNVTVTTVGTGRVIFLSTANTFTGNVTISPNSVLQLSDGSATANSLIPDTANVTVNAGAAFRLAKGGNSETINSLFGSGTVTAISGGDTLAVGGSGTFAGVLTQGAGTLNLTKQGSGTFTLTGTSNYTGNTRITAGTLTLAGNNSLGANILNAATDTTAVLSFGSNTAFIGNSGANSGQFYYGLLDGTGTMQLRGGSATITGTNGATFSTTANYQIFNQAGTLSPTAFALNTGVSDTDRKDFAWINDNGTALTLSSLAGYGALRNDAGGTGGVLSLRTYVVDQSSDTVFDGAILSHRSSGNALRGLSLEKRGSGSLTLAGFIGKQLSGANAGAVAVNLIADGGLLNITNPANSTAASSDAINSSGTVTITSGTLAFSSQALINTAGNAGVASIRMNGGVLRWNAGTTQDLTAGASSRLTLVSGSTATFDTNGNDVTLANALGGGAIAAPVVKIGGGSLTLSGSNLYTGDTTISGGTLAIGGAGQLGSGGSYAGAITNNAAFVVDSSANQTLSGVVSGVGSLTKSGAGTLTLSNASNSFSGGSTISGGVLSYASGGLGTTGAVTMNGGTLRWESGNTEDISSRVSLVNAATATFDTNGNAVSFASALGGGTTAALTKAGNGSLTLTTASAYTGLTTVSGGTLALSGGGSIQSSSGVNLSDSGATLDISGADGDRTIGSLAGAGNSLVVLGGNALTAGDATNTTFGGGLSGSGGFTKAGAGILTLTAAQSLFTGDVNVAAGTLKLDGANYLQQVADSIFVAENATLDASAAGLTVFNGQTLGGYGLVNAGANALAFNSGAFLSPGGSVGQLDGVGAATFNGGMTYLFEINDANGTFGTSPGWDLFTTTGTLTLAVSGGNPINLDILSLAGSGTGLAANFDPTFNYAWKFVVAGAPISSFSPTVFNVDATGFSNPTNGGQFYVARGDQLGSIGGSGTDEELYVVFAAVPEPSTVVLAGIGLAAAGVAAARRRRRVNREGSVG